MSTIEDCAVMFVALWLRTAVPREAIAFFVTQGIGTADQLEDFITKWWFIAGGPVPRREHGYHKQHSVSCFDCGKVGYVVKDWWKGKPQGQYEWVKPKVEVESRAKPSNNYTCHSCRDPNHFIKDCPHIKQTQHKKPATYGYRHKEGKECGMGKS